MNGAGIKIMAAMLEKDPNKRFGLDMMDETSPIFNDEVKKQFTITKEEMDD